MSKRAIFTSIAAVASTMTFSWRKSFCHERVSEDEPRQPSFRSTDNLRRSLPIKQDREIPVTLDQLVLISGNGHKGLAFDISHLLGVPLAKAQLSRFSDGEVSIAIEESLRGKNVFILQSCVAPVNDNIMELLLTVSCARREGANRVIAVIPYFGYKHHRRGSSLSTKHHSRFLTSGATDFAKMLQAMGVDRVIAVDLQRAGQGHEACFFDNSVPLETVISTEYQMDYFIKKVPFQNPVVVVAPNAESVKRARNFQLRFQNELEADVKMATFIIEQQQDFSNLSQNTQRHRLLGNPKVTFPIALFLLCFAMYINCMFILLLSIVSPRGGCCHC